jgi:hypothetical protein
MTSLRFNSCQNEKGLSAFPGIRFNGWLMQVSDLKHVMQILLSPTTSAIHT